MNTFGLTEKKLHICIDIHEYNYRKYRSHYY